MINDTLTDRLNRALAKLKDAEADERIVVLLSKEEIEEIVCFYKNIMIKPLPQHPEWQPKGTPPWAL